MTPGQRLRQIANVVNLSTPLGLVIAVASKSPRRPGPRGLIITSDYAWKLPKAGAFTMGNVVLYRAGRDVAGRNEVLLGHEERHSTQYAYCLGLPFLVFYGAAACWSVLRTGNPGLANIFERQAGLEAGGYISPPGQHRHAGEGIEAA